MAGRRKRGPRGQGYCTWDERRQRWRVTVPTDGGRTLSRYFMDRGAADAWHEEQRQRIRAGQQPVRPPTLAQALADYIAVHTPGTSPGTVRQYRYRSKRLLSLLGNPVVTAITPARVATLDQELRAHLADGTVQGLLDMLQGVYTRLIALDIGVTRNPVAAYRAVTPRRARMGRPAREPVVLDPAHCRALLAALREEDCYLAPFVSWLVCLPLRVSELRGLRWANVDAGRMVVRIVEQRTHADPHAPGDPKTAGSVRDLPLTAKLLRLAGRRRGGTDLVFPNVAGGPVFDETLRGQLDRAVARLAREGQPLPVFRVHDLRHTAASNMLRLGCPINYERALLGHAPADITEQYARPDVEALRPWVDAWSAALFSRDPGAAQQTA